MGCTPIEGPELDRKARAAVEEFESKIPRDPDVAHAYVKGLYWHGWSSTPERWFTMMRFDWSAVFARACARAACSPLPGCQIARWRPGGSGVAAARVVAHGTGRLLTSQLEDRCTWTCSRRRWRNMALRAPVTGSTGDVTVLLRRDGSGRPLTLARAIRSERTAPRRQGSGAVRDRRAHPPSDCASAIAIRSTVARSGPASEWTTRSAGRDRRRPLTVRRAWRPRRGAPRSRPP